MKVVHLITGLAPGGAENQLRLMLRHTRHDARVITLTNPGAVADAIQREGTPVVNVDMRSNRDVTALGALVRELRASPCDVLHAHLFRSCIYGPVAGRLAGVPRVVTTEHSLGDGYIEGRPTTRATRVLYLAAQRLADTTIAVSRRVRDRLIGWGVPANRIVVIPNGIDVDSLRFDPTSRAEARRELGVPDDAFVIGAVGRLDPVKRFDALIEASVPLLGPATRLLIVGEGPARDELIGRARALGVPPYVVFAGERTDVARMLSAMDVMAAPSLSETFGLAVVEALASGLPVLYTECPALAELHDHGGARARPVPAEPHALEVAIRNAQARPPSDRNPAASVVERFGIRASTVATDDLYEAVAPVG